MFNQFTSQQKLSEDLATGHDSPWLNWRCMNRLRTGYTCSKEQRKKWGYFNGDTTCECGLATENTSHMLPCTLLAHPCTLDDLLDFNDTAQACIQVAHHILGNGISLLCRTYKLYERMILNRIAPAIKQHLIKEHAGFRSRKSCTSQLQTSHSIFRMDTKRA